MPSHILRLFTDRLAAGAALELPAGAVRALYLAEGNLAVAAAGTTASLAPNSAWLGDSSAAWRAGAAGARVLRFELVRGAGADADAVGADGIESALTLAAPLTLDAASPCLLRCDRVEFPPGGVAYLHCHQGPGIRCLQSGRIRIETRGTTHGYAPGEAWFETGPDPVFAAASETEATAFIRVMILPRALQGRSSIRYLRPEDQDKPKRQSYQIYLDAPIEP